MFFRRRRPRAPTFEERLQALREAGFEVRIEPNNPVRVSRGASGALIIEDPPRILLAGRISRGQIARLADRGFQKFWRAPDGEEAPALAEHLSELHAFEEDLRETLGLVSLYNTSLGTTNDMHLYDRAAPPSISKSP